MLNGLDSHSHLCAGSYLKCVNANCRLLFCGVDVDFFARRDNVSNVCNIFDVSVHISMCLEFI